MDILGTFVALIFIAGLIIPIVVIIFHNPSEKDAHYELLGYILITYFGLSALGYVVNFLFHSKIAVCVTVFLGLIIINFLIIKDHFF